MSRIMIPATFCKVGEILANDVTNDKDIIIVVKNTVVNQYIKDISCISESVKKAVLLHHERIDCSGYPFGYSSSAMSLLANIVSVADVYDAMTQDRVYKNKVAPFDDFEMFLTVGKSMFDNTVLNAFFKNIVAFYVGANMILNNGNTGEIVCVPPEDILSPIIRVRSNYIDLSRERSLKVLSLL